VKIYLAASWNARPQMRDLRDQLVAKGYTVTSRWIDSNKPNDDPSELMMEALSDVEGVERADLVVAFTDTPSTTGGMHVEWGIALGLEKHTALVGPETCLFHTLADQRFADAESWLASLPDRSTPLALVEESYR
jgi:nucleoside 2-deoxyribosyltransferase